MRSCSHTSRRIARKAVGGEAGTLARIIAASIQVKAAVVAEDEKESGVRMILNFGHTGRACDRGGDGVRQAAARGGGGVGIDCGAARGAGAESDFAGGVCADREPDRGVRTFAAVSATAERLVALSASDKKNRSGRRAFVLTKGVGRVEVVHDVSDVELRGAAEAMLGDMRRLTASGAAV